MSKMSISSATMKGIHSILNAPSMSKEAVLLKVSDNNVTIMDKNESNTVMVGIQAKLISSDGDFDVPMFIKDMKDIIELSKNSDIELDVQAGKTICKIGKIKKTVPQPTGITSASKKFNIIFPLKMLMSKEDSENILKSFAFTEDADVYIVTSGSTINISSTSGNRKTEIDFLEEDLQGSVIEEDINARYDAMLFLPTLKSLPIDKSVLIEADANKPAKISIDNNDFAVRVYIAPRILETN